IISTDLRLAEDFCKKLSANITYVGIGDRDGKRALSHRFVPATRSRAREAGATKVIDEISSADRSEARHQATLVRLPCFGCRFSRFTTGRSSSLCRSLMMSQSSNTERSSSRQPSRDLAFARSPLN